MDIETIQKEKEKVRKALAAAVETQLGAFRRATGYAIDTINIDLIPEIRCGQSIYKEKDWLVRSVEIGVDIGL